MKDPYCCYVYADTELEKRCETAPEWEILATRGNAIAGPDPYSDDTHSCTRHVGDLLGHQPDAVDPEEIYWEIRPLAISEAHE